MNGDGCDLIALKLKRDQNQLVVMADDHNMPSGFGVEVSLGRILDYVLQQG
jgi:hypothetical protein